MTSITTKFLRRPIHNVVIASISGLLILSANITLAHSDHKDCFDSEEFDAEEKIVRIIECGTLTDVVQMFDNGLDINHDINGDGTPLIIAVRRGDQKLVEQMLNRGADINRESEQDGNPLIVAALRNNLSLVDYLYKQGAEIDAITKYDETALISASRAGHFQIVEYLVENGADVNLAVEANVMRGKEWRSPLNGAKTKQIRDFLIANGAKS